MSFPVSSSHSQDPLTAYTSLFREAGIENLLNLGFEENKSDNRSVIGSGNSMSFSPSFGFSMPMSYSDSSTNHTSTSHSSTTTIHNTVTDHGALHASQETTKAALQSNESNSRELNKERKSFYAEKSEDERKSRISSLISAHKQQKIIAGLLPFLKEPAIPEASKFLTNFVNEEIDELKKARNDSRSIFLGDFWDSVQSSKENEEKAQKIISKRVEIIDFTILEIDKILTTYTPSAPMFPMALQMVIPALICSSVVASLFPKEQFGTVFSITGLSYLLFVGYVAAREWPRSKINGKVEYLKAFKNSLTELKEFQDASLYKLVYDNLSLNRKIDLNSLDSRKILERLSHSENTESAKIQSINYLLKTSLLFFGIEKPVYFQTENKEQVTTDKQSKKANPPDAKNKGEE